MMRFSQTMPKYRSAYVTSRGLISLAFCSIGLLLGLFGSGSPQSRNALAQSPHQFEANVLERGSEDTEAPSILGTCDTTGPVEVEATVGALGPTAYPNLGSAIAAINAGTHQGIINVEICGSTTETGSIFLNSNGAAPASYISVTIRPLADGLTIAGPTLAGRGLIELNGADNVLIDGDNPNTIGTNRNLTIQNAAANTINYTSVVRIALNTSTVTTADNVTIRNLNLLGSAIGRNISTATSIIAPENTTFGIVAGGQASGVTTAPNAILTTGSLITSGATANNLTIENDSISAAARGVSVGGAATTIFPGLLIQDNVIGNATPGGADQIYSVGITAQGSANGVIRRNVVFVEGYIAASTSFTMGIDVGSASAAGAASFTIEKNMISRVRNNNGGTYPATGIDLGGGNNHIVQNNFVTDVRNDQTAGTVGGGVLSPGRGAAGIRVQSGAGHKIYHNSVHLCGVLPGTTSTDLIAAFMGSLASSDVRNNIFSNVMTGGNPVQTNTRLVAIYLPSGGTTSTNLILNNNNYVEGTSVNSRMAQVGVTPGSGEYTAANFDPTSTVPATNFRAYTSALNAGGTNDNASQKVDPLFVSCGDLHINPASPMVDMGVDLGLTDDKDGDPRPNCLGPDIGADEIAGGICPTPTPSPSPIGTITPTPPPPPTPTPTPTPTPPTTVTHFIVDAPSSVVQYFPFTFTVTAQDQNNFTVTDYPRTVHFSSTDSTGTLPPDGPLTNGTGTFQAFLRTPGSQTITVSDTSDPSISGTSFPIFVNAKGQATPTATATVGTPTPTATASPTATATATAVAPSPPPFDGFDPNANGTIRAVVVQPDGKILLGGDFTSLSPNGGAPVTRNRIARLNPDGTLDLTFDPNANNSVNSIAIQADGKVLAGGSFTSIGGQTRNRIARLDAVTGSADSLDPNANSTVFALAVQSDGKILAGGFFNNIGGQTRSRIARLDTTTGQADSFDPNANGPEIFTIVIQSDGKILVGGFFTSIGGQTRNNIARLDPATGFADGFNPNASDEVRCIAVQADGKVLAGGFFPMIGGQSRNSIARLDPTNGLADSFNPNANNGVFAIAVQSDGKILAGGDFFGIGGQSRHLIARLDPATGLADSFDPSANSTVNAIAIQADRKILVCGSFTMLAPNGGGSVTRNRIARLETDGRLDLTIGSGIANSPVYATAVQPDGKILIGGGFSSVLGVPRNFIARLNADGSLDTAFNPNASAVVEVIAVQTDGKILVGGIFNSIGGQMRNRIARVDPTTGLADNFNPNANSDVYAIALQADGKILTTGVFSSIGGQSRRVMARLDPSTGLADSFNPNPNALVYSLVVQPDGKILVGGDFTTIGGQTRFRMARLDPTGLADSFSPIANGRVYSIAVQGDGKILAGGLFGIIGGQSRSGIARLDGTTSSADSFNPAANNGIQTIAVQADSKILVGGFFANVGGQARSRIARLDAVTGLADNFNPIANDVVYSIALQSDGKVLTGGNFTSMGGQPRAHFARLSNDTAALQQVTVTASNITWALGGSSPQFSRVSFESSPDNVSYCLLGIGTMAGSNWVLTGLNLPIGQGFYIRARGYLRSGENNASEGLAESVQNVFIAPPVPTPTPTPTPPISISGTISYCSNPVPGPVAAVTLNLTGSTSGSTLSDSSGNYTFSSLPSGGNYTVTPSKTPLPPGSAGITTVDVVAVQRHFLVLGTPLSGCRLTAGDVTGDTAINTLDVIAIQRFFLVQSTGIANVGKYQFNPSNRSYPGIVSDQTAQNYDAVIFGDVTAPYVSP